MDKNIISKIISFLLLLFSLTLLFYIFYKSEIVHSGNIKDYYFKYYIFSILLILLSLTSFLINYSAKINVLLVLFSIIVGLLTVESYLIFKQKPIYGEKNETDPRKPIQVYKELKSQDYVMYISPSNFIGNNNSPMPYSMSGISNSKTIFCNENGYYVYYTSDRYGFGNPDFEWDKKKIDYLIVGDSFGKGACVNEDKSISGNLRKFNNQSVINLSNSGNGPLTQYATLREYLNQINVKNILWFYFEGNDLYNLEIELKNKNLINYINNKNYSQNLYQKQDEIDLKLRKFLNKKFENYNFSKKEKINFESIVQFLKLTNVRNITIERNYKYLTIVPDEFEKILISTKIFAEKNDANLYFIYIPDLSRYERKNFNDLDYLSYGEVLRIVKKLNIKLIDLNILLFSKLKKPNSLRPYIGAHYNEKGYELISKTIYKELSK